MLYHKKPDMKELHKWEKQVWVHTPSGTKFDGRSKIGRWIGYDEASNGHKVYWPYKHSVTVEQSIKLVNDSEILPSNSIDMLIQQENDLTNSRNRQHNPKTKSPETETQELTENHKETAIDFVTDNPSNADTSNCNPINFIAEK